MHNFVHCGIAVAGTAAKYILAELSKIALAAIAAEPPRGPAQDNKATCRFDTVTEANCAAERALRTAIEAVS